MFEFAIPAAFLLSSFLADKIDCSIRSPEREIEWRMKEISSLTFRFHDGKSEVKIFFDRDGTFRLKGDPSPFGRFGRPLAWSADQSDPKKVWLVFESRDGALNIVRVGVSDTLTLMLFQDQSSIRVFELTKEGQLKYKETRWGRIVGQGSRQVRPLPLRNMGSGW